MKVFANILRYMMLCCSCLTATQMIKKSTYDSHMWYEIVLENTDAFGGLAMCYQLRDDGLCQGKDFEWEYCPAYDAQIPKKSVVLRFRDSALATFYTLKWQH